MKAYLEDWHNNNSNNNNNNNLIKNYPINEKTTINHIGKMRNKYKNNYYKEYNKNKFNGNGRFKTNKNNNKIKNKLYCHICKKHSHNTEKCRFNLLTNKKHLKNRRHSHSLSSNKQNNINFIGNIDNTMNNGNIDDNINYDDIRPLIERTIGCLYYTSYNEELIKYLNDDNHLTSNQNNTSQVKLPQKEYNTNYIDNDTNQNSNHMKNNSLIY